MTAPLQLSSLLPEELVELRANIERWRWHPIDFFFEVFGPGYLEETGRTLESETDRWQLRVLAALIVSVRIAMKACKGPGKTAILAVVIWWFLLTRQHPKIAAASITGDNLFDNLWTELAVWQHRSPLLSRLFTHTDSGIFANDHPKDWWCSPRTFRQDADETQQANTMAGLHQAAILVVLDEVGDFPPGVFAAAEAIFTVEGQEAMLVVAGNPTSVDGPLYRICTEEADRWHIEEITGDPDDPNRARRISRKEAAEQIRIHGRRDPVVMVNILGKFPPRSGNKLLGPDDVALAMKRNPPERYWIREPMVWGIDVAAGGLDNSVLFKRRGVVAFKPQIWRDLTDDALADRIAWEFFEDRKKKKEPRKIFIDRGGVGRGVWVRLKSLLPEGVVIGVDFGEMALDDTQYADRRTEMWCLMAEWIREVGSIPSIPELRIDLTGPVIGIAKTVTKGTRRKLEDKESLKKRGYKSPDEGDSLALTWAAPVFNEAMDTAGTRGRGRVAQTDFDPFQHLREMGEN